MKIKINIRGVKSLGRNILKDFDHFLTIFLCLWGLTVGVDVSNR